VKNAVFLLENKLVFLTGLVVFIATFFFSLSFAQMSSDKLSSLLLKMEEVDKKINTLKADYTQTIFFESTKEKQEVLGTIYLKKPGSIYINQRAPQEQQIYIDGKNITIYTPDNGQAVIDNWKNVIDGDFAPVSIVSFGSSWREIKKTNKISFGGESEKYIVVKIEPVRNKDWNIKIYISKTTMYPSKAVSESNGAKVKIIFKNYTINPLLDKNMFKLNVSDEVEVIKLN
jgi:outer membrane lipoprotein carrier protein